MGFIMDFVKRQLIEVIEWMDDTNETLVHRFPDNDNEIKNGAQLIVRPGQACVFVHEGEIGDVFGPGRYALTTSNIPVLTTLKSWKYGFDSPFKCEVYFINTRQYADMKWGTNNPSCCVTLILAPCVSVPSAPTASASPIPGSSWKR